MWDILKNPKKQLIAITITVIGYWTVDVFIISHDTPVQMIESEQTFDDSEERQMLELQIDTTIVDADSTRQRNDIDVTYKDDEMIVTERTIEQLPQSYIFWEMILSHISSILGSLTALLTPLITVYLNKKGYFKQDDN